MEWFCVDDFLPEQCKLCHFHKDSSLEFTTVLVMNKYGNMEIMNRLKVNNIGSEYLDEYATDGWEWSNGLIEPKWWLPIPRNKDLFKNRGQYEQYSI